MNGARQTVTVEPRVTLLNALRNHLDLTGAGQLSLPLANRALLGQLPRLADVLQHRGRAGKLHLAQEALAPGKMGQAFGHVGVEALAVRRDAEGGERRISGGFQVGVLAFHAEIAGPDVGSGQGEVGALLAVDGRHDFPALRRVEVGQNVGR